MANHSVLMVRVFLFVVIFLEFTTTMYSQTPLRIGVIGLDTSHAPAFAKLFNSDNATGLLANQTVTHAFPGGSHDIEQSHSRVPGYTNELSNMGIKIVDSIDNMLPEIDAVLLLSVDGRKHFEQVAPVFKAGKPVFIDKPLGGTLAECIAIKKLADHYNAAWFTSSSLRFSPEMIRYREDPNRQGTVIGATSWGPCSLEATHPDLFWYGVHGVEVLYTAMGTGCETVTRIATPDTDVAVGVWNDRRIGDFRGLRAGASGYGLVVFGKQAIEVGGKYEGYGPLVNRIAQFFHDRTGGVEHAESIEMFTFMEAADESKRLGGVPVKLSDVYSKAELQANELIKPWLE